MSAYVKIYQDDFNFCLELLDNKFVKCNEAIETFENLIHEYEEEYKHLSWYEKFILHCKTEFTTEQTILRKCDDYKFKVELLKNYKFSVEKLIGYFDLSIKCIYLDINDYNFIIK